MHKSCHSRIYNLMVHHNSTRRVVPISSSSTNPWNDINKPLVDKFEIRLQPGLNKIEVVLQAGPIQRGPVRHVTQQLPSEGREEEKYIIWAMLQKAVGPWKWISCKALTAKSWLIACKTSLCQSEVSISAQHYNYDKSLYVLKVVISAPYGEPKANKNGGYLMLGITIYYLIVLCWVHFLYCQIFSF